jgi:hypothetical protein
MSVDQVEKVFILTNREALRALGQMLRDGWEQAAKDDNPLQVCISTFDPPRSDEANAYYWAVTLKQAADQVEVDGHHYPPRSWHEEMREKFAPRIDNDHGLSFPMSTSKMSRSVFNRYVMRCEEYFMQVHHVRYTERFEEHG